MGMCTIFLRYKPARLRNHRIYYANHTAEAPWIDPFICQLSPEFIVCPLFLPGL